MRENRCAWADQYDWERFSQKKMKKLTPLDWVIPQDEMEPFDTMPNFVMPNLEAFDPWGPWKDLEISERGDVTAKNLVLGGCC
jgi:hypothetical protein